MSFVLARIEAPHFVAGLDIEGGRVSAAAPIVAYMIGWSAVRVKEYCDRKGWEIARVLSAAQPVAAEDDR